MRSSIRRTWRSVTFNRLAAATCVRCFCFTSCNTFNRSRSRWLKAMRSDSMGPSANHECGHFYFAQTGHSHFAATAFNGNIDNGARFGYHLPREVRMVAPSGGVVSQPSLVSPPAHSVGEDVRRSPRIERSVPLIVSGQNRLGEPFVERTVSTSLNLHGCRYPSRHDYGVGSWVTLQVVGLEVEPKPPAVRARVCSVHTSQSLRELQQVGVELENPGNVWGIVTPPQDWMKVGGTNTAVAQFATAVAPALDPPPTTLKIDELPVNPEHKMAEVATFPFPSPVASKSAPRAAEASQPKRVGVTPDGLISAVQEKLQHAAEQAVEGAIEIGRASCRERV